MKAIRKDFRILAVVFGRMASLWVHGWNMASWEKDRFAGTAFKRLCWQGPQGRRGVFRAFQ